MACTGTPSVCPMMSRQANSIAACSWRPVVVEARRRIADRRSASPPGGTRRVRAGNRRARRTPRAAFFAAASHLAQTDVPVRGLDLDDRAHEPPPVRAVAVADQSWGGDGDRGGADRRDRGRRHEWRGTKRADGGGKRGDPGGARPSRCIVRCRSQPGRSRRFVAMAGRKGNDRQSARGGGAIVPFVIRDGARLYWRSDGDPASSAAAARQLARNRARAVGAGGSGAAAALSRASLRLAWTRRLRSVRGRLYDRDARAGTRSQWRMRPGRAASATSASRSAEWSECGSARTRAIG